MFRTFLKRTQNPCKRHFGIENIAPKIRKNFEDLINSYDKEPQDLEAFQKRLIYRSSNLGMLELDLLVGTWAKQYLPKMNIEECQRYEREIISIETPDLHKVLLCNEKEFEDFVYGEDHFISSIRKFGKNPSWNQQ